MNYYRRLQKYVEIEFNCVESKLTDSYSVETRHESKNLLLENSARKNEYKVEINF